MRWFTFSSLLSLNCGGGSTHSALLNLGSPHCTGLVATGGQELADGTVLARITRLPHGKSKGHLRYCCHLTLLNWDH